jgi:flagellar hook assembly protein FlgD
VSSPNSKLLIALDLSKNPVSAGGKETLKATVYNAANSTLTIPGASVNVTITDSANRTVSNFNGTTNNFGIFTFTWKVSKDSKPGVFTVGVHASANGYQNQSTPTRTTFNVVSASLHKSSTSSTSPTHHVHKSSSDIYSQSPLSIIRIPHITFPQIHFPKTPSFY